MRDVIPTVEEFARLEPEIQLAWLEKILQITEHFVSKPIETDTALINDFGGDTE